MASSLRNDSENTGEILCACSDRTDLQRLQCLSERSWEAQLRVFREFNVEADGLANEAIDSYVPAMHQTGVVVNDRWIDESMS